MSLETLTNLTGGLPGTAPKIFSAATADNLATVEATGYLNAYAQNLSANDVIIMNISDGDSANQKVYFGYVTNPSAGVYNWVQGLQGGSGGGSGAVSSVFGRTGAVVATSGDYSVAEVTGAAPLAAPSFTGGITVAGGATITGNASVTGNLSLASAGNKIEIATGSNASAGVATLSGGSITVSTTAVTANSIILLTRQKLTGTAGDIAVGAKTAGTSFAILSSSSGDDSDIGWVIIN